MRLGGRATSGALVVALAFLVLSTSLATVAWSSASWAVGPPRSNPALVPRWLAHSGVQPAVATPTDFATADTIDLYNDSTVPGTYVPPDGTTPLGAVFDPANDEVLVGDESGFVSVFSGATDALLATIPGPQYSAPSDMVYDNVTGQIFASAQVGGLGDVLVISPTTSSIVAEIPVLLVPSGIAYDAAQGQVFVADELSSGLYVTAISASNNSVVANIPMGKPACFSPSAVAYDGADDVLFVADCSAVAVVSPISDTVLQRIPMGFGVRGLAYDPGKGQVFVSGGSPDLTVGPSDVTVLNASSRGVVVTLQVAAGAQALAYDPDVGGVYVAFYTSTNVSLINDSTDTATLTAAVGLGPAAFAIDPDQHELFVANLVSSNLTVVSESTGSTVVNIPVGANTWALAYDPVREELFAADMPSNTVRVISGTSQKVVASVPVGSVPQEMAVDPGRGEVFVVNAGSNNVSVINATSDQVVATVPVGSGPEGIAYDSGRGEVVVANAGSATLTFISDSNNSAVATVEVGGGPSASAPADLLYVAPYGELLVTDQLTNTVRIFNDTTDRQVANLKVGDLPAGLAYDARNQLVYVADEFHNTVTMVSPAKHRIVGSITVAPASDPWGPLDVAYDSAQGEVLLSNYLTDNLTMISDATNRVVANAPVPGAYGLALDTATGDAYVTSDYLGTVTVLVPAYPVTFHAEGLPEGSAWGVTLGSPGTFQMNYTNAGGGTLTFAVPPPSGTVPMSIAAPSGYGVWEVSGPNQPTQTAVNITGPAVLTVRFAPLETVYFNETGLPGGTSWTVRISPGVGHGGPSPQNATTTGSSLGFVVAKGTWKFQVTSGSPQWVPVPSHGEVAVPAHPATKRLHFRSV